MAFDKVVDSSVLDAGLKQIADAIREKGGTTDNLEFPADMAEAIAAIEAGVELPTLENPADEASVVKDMEFIGADGTAKKGTMPALFLGGISEVNENSGIEEYDGRKRIFLGGNTINSQTSYVYPGYDIAVYMYDTDEKMSMFGDAKPENVAAGKTFTSKEGFTKVGTHVCTGGTGSKPVILSVEKITSNTYVGSTSYTDEQFILLDIYPKSGGTVMVTYGDLTKTIVDDGTSETPPAQQVFFGTFGGVADEVETPSSGGLIIDGDYAAFGIGGYSKTSKESGVCGCITDVVDFGTMDYIPDNAFGKVLTGGCQKLKRINLPYNLKSIGEAAFAHCGLEYLAIPYGITTLPATVATKCQDLRDIIIPSSVTTLEESAISMNRLKFVTIPESVTYLGTYALDVGRTLQYIRILATTPPTVGEDFLDLEYSNNFVAFIVPAGCGETYKTAEGWSAYADYIMEDSDPEEA